MTDRPAGFALPPDGTAFDVTLPSAALRGDDDALAATTIGDRYRVLALLGRGGMGAVYRVRDEVLDEVVALKMLRRELLGSADAVARFVQEVKLARRVTHANVARTFDIGEHGGDRFLTMEWIDGESLAALLARRGRLPLDEVIRIGGAVCAGVGAAHAVGVVHRDLKPENVMIAADGRVVVTDFGIARASSSADRTEGVIGTPAYMAPEQLQGAPVDARTDVYAIGEILYELAAGVRAWPGDQPFVVGLAKLRDNPPDLRLRVRVPDAFAALVARCLEREVDRRPASAADVHAALGVIVLDRQPTPPAPERRPRARIALAVQSFRSESPEDRAIARGLSEDLIDTLSTVERIRVRGAPHAGDDAYDPDDGGRELGRALGVDVVLSGTLRRSDDGVRLTARITGVADGFRVWSKRFAAPRAKLLEIADELAEEVAEALATRLDAPHRAEIDAGALEHYLLGRDLTRRNWYDPPSLAPAIAALEEALARAPEEPTFLAASATALSRGRFTPASMRLALGRAERALSLAPHFAEAWMALAIVHGNQGNLLGAVAPAAEASRRGPSLAPPLAFLGGLFAEVGPLENARDLLVRARELDPTPQIAQIATVLCSVLFYMGDPAAARRAIDSQDHTVSHIVAGSSLRLSLWMRERPVIAELSPAARAIPLIPALQEMARDGRVSEPTEAALAAFVPPAFPRFARLITQFRAELRAAAGDVEGTLGHARAAVDHGLVDLFWMTRCPLFEEARRDARWAPLEAIVSARADELRDALLRERIA